MVDSGMVVSGGIDLGGTKIEAQLFDAEWRRVDAKRVATPNKNYDDLLQALAGQVRLLQERSGNRELPIGIGVPGQVDRETGAMSSANLPLEERDLRRDLERETGRLLPFINDCRAFTLSEATLGAGRNDTAVLGLILGTGVAGGLAIDGVLVQGRNGAAGEFGHVPIAATLAEKHRLPMLRCGCGAIGCYETFVSGPGLVRLAKALFQLDITTKEIAERLAAGDKTCLELMEIWAEITCAMLQTIILVADPDCIVLGGGLSNIDGIAARLEAQLPLGLLNRLRAPPIYLAEAGDSSGARGAAMVAMGAGWDHHG